MNLATKSLTSLFTVLLLGAVACQNETTSEGDSTSDLVQGGSGHGSGVVDPESGGEIRVNPCSPGSKKLVAGDASKMRATDSFFQWTPAREQWFELKGNECMSTPFFVDDARSLQLSLLAPLAEINERLQEHGLEAIPASELGKYKVVQDQGLIDGLAAAPGDNIEPSELAKSALVTVVGNDFANTPAGPIQPSHVFVWVKPAANCYLNEATCTAPGMFFWKYYVDSLRAKYAGEQLWGLLKKVGDSRFHYQGNVKKYAYYDGGLEGEPRQQVYSMEWNQTNRPPAVRLVAGEPMLGANGQPVTGPDGKPVAFPGFAMNLVGITPQQQTTGALAYSPGQTFNLVKWAASNVYIDLFRNGIDTFEPNETFDFFAPIRGLKAKPFMWAYYEDNRIVYHADQPPHVKRTATSH